MANRDSLKKNRERKERAKREEEARKEQESSATETSPPLGDEDENSSSFMPPENKGGGEAKNDESTHETGNGEEGEKKKKSTVETVKGFFSRKNLSEKAGNVADVVMHGTDRNIDMEQKVNINKSDDEIVRSVLSNTKGGRQRLEDELEGVGGKTLVFITMLPYRVFSYILYLGGMALVPQDTIVKMSKFYVPMLFTVLIFALLFTSGAYISLGAVEEMFFADNFIPIVGWIVGFIAIAIFLMFVVFGSTGQLSGDEETTSNRARGIAIGSVLLMVGLSFWSTGATFSDVWYKITIFLSSFIGYFVYMAYIFLAVTISFLLYQKIMYVFFSFINKEFDVVIKNAKQIAIYATVIIVINILLQINIVAL